MVKNPPTNAGGLGLIPGLGRSPEIGNGNQFQYSCLENAMDRGAWWAAPMGSQRVRHNWVTEHTHRILLEKQMSSIHISETFSAKI